MFLGHLFPDSVSARNCLGMKAVMWLQLLRFGEAQFVLLLQFKLFFRIIHKAPSCSPDSRDAMLPKELCAVGFLVMWGVCFSLFSLFPMSFLVQGTLL